jgi:sulfite reductase (NADPH) flavoprotein alpha-component
MIGAGTGVAPFRAFLTERAEAGATGRNWLVFGDRSFELDFLYQFEWLQARKRGTLHRLDVAFSRDQPSKVYVQHRLLENAGAVWDWLERGAHVFVCGDAKRMAPDVDDALQLIARRHGGRSDDGARELLADLMRERRYQRDVW